jgi:hypothetical protein
MSADTHRTAPGEVASVRRVDEDFKCGDCDALAVCMICDTCAQHCLTDGDPDACWKAHERWRLGGPDDSLQSITASMPPIGVRAAPKPRWGPRS